MSNNSDIWVIFDGFGVQIFYTLEEQYANFNYMQDEYYNKEKCSIFVNVPGFSGQGSQACEKDMDTGVITIIQRSREYQAVVPHVPAP
jgi:hypothetical protein